MPVSIDIFIGHCLERNLERMEFMLESGRLVCSEDTFSPAFCPRAAYYLGVFFQTSTWMFQSLFCVAFFLYGVPILNILNIF